MDRVLKYGWLALFAAPILISATSDSDASKGTVLSVSGVGYGTAQGTETFTVRAGSRTFSSYPARAMRDNAEVLAALREQLAGKGIDKRDISTSNFEFRPGRDPEDNDDPAMGYIASQQLVVFVRNPDQAGAVIEALIEAGATDVSVQNYRGWWGGSERPPLAVEAAARKQAVADARKKADDYAAALGMRISRVVSVNDGGVRITGEPAPAARVTALDAPTQIDNGESAVVASVNMQFELAPK